MIINIVNENKKYISNYRKLTLYFLRREKKLFFNWSSFQYGKIQRSVMLNEALSRSVPYLIKFKNKRRLNITRKFVTCNYKKSNLGHTVFPRYRKQLITQRKKMATLNKFVAVLTKGGKRDRAYRILEEILLKLNYLRQNLFYKWNFNKKYYKKIKRYKTLLEISSKLCLIIVLNRAAPVIRLARHVKAGRVHFVPCPVTRHRRIFIASKMLITLASKNKTARLNFVDALVFEIMAFLFFPKKSKLKLEREYLHKYSKRFNFNLRYLKFISK